MESSNERKIRSWIVLAGVTQTAIAESIGVKPSSVNDVIAGRRKTKRIREAIAKAIKMPVSEIWPAKAA
ncbi:MAG: helix-turn-helix domain-containing protein [Desulfobulbaceae bacterium]|nr:helix-turn-helix domain-containing protein [Desulfobulbaceae bacterium]